MATLTNDSPTMRDGPPPSGARLRLEPAGSSRTILDGCWWPSSDDPAAELPGLVLALDQMHGPVVRLLLSAAGWSHRPHRIEVAGRTVSLGYFSNQPATQLTATCANGDRICLTIMPPAPARA